MLYTKIIGGILAAIVVVGGGYSIFNNQKTAPTEQSSGVASTSTASANGSTTAMAEVKTSSGKKIPFSEFIKQTGSYKCTVHQDVSGSNIVGTVYIDGGMVSGEYNAKVQNFSITAHVIVRDGFSYMWTSMAPTMGYKSKVTASASTNTSAPSAGSYAFNAEQIGDYSCEATPSNPALFTVPTSITFKTV